MSAVTASAAVTVPAPRRALDDAAAVSPELWVPEARQWLSTSASRMASDGYSWMQGVHWVAGAGLYEPRRYRSHGPRSFGTTTVVVAQLLAELSPCRPGIEYLMHRTGLSERTVEYHLQILRETGLLAWEQRGTRVRGERPQASVYARMLPPEFDAALGIRTVGEGTGRRMSGIADGGRELMARLAREAARKVRRLRARTRAQGIARKASIGASATAVFEGERCTPMGGGADASSTAGTTSFPPESELASGEGKSRTRKDPKLKINGGWKLNRVGRRFQLARELTQQIDWLRGSSVPRIAWVARHVADAGWTVTDVRGWLHLRGETLRARRASGMLAVLLAGAETILDTPQKRADAVEQWRGSQEAARRHRIQQVRARAERLDADWEAPSSRRVQREVEGAFAQVREAASRGRHQDQDLGVAHPDGRHELSEQELQELRDVAWGQLMMAGETGLVMSAVDCMGRPAAERVYGADLVRRAGRIVRGAHSALMTYGSRVDA